jgi:hypothetical protein
VDSGNVVAINSFFVCSAFSIIAISSYCRAGEPGIFIVGVKTLKVQLIPSGLARKLLLFCVKRT